MLTKKCLSVLMLVVAVKFSQTFASPTPEESTTLPEGNAEESAQPQEQPQIESEPAPVADSEQAPVADSEPAPVADSDQTGVPEEASTGSPFNPQPMGEMAPSGPLPIELPPQMLTKEEERKILQKVPEFETIMTSIEQLPIDTYETIKTFVMKIVPQMPPNNLVTMHFQNALLMVRLFERLVRAATTTPAEQDMAERQELFSKVHEFVPKLKEEVDFTKKFIQHAQSILPRGGTSVDPLGESSQFEKTAGGEEGETAKQFENVKLPIEETGSRDEFVEEFAPAATPQGEEQS